MSFEFKTEANIIANYPIADRQFAVLSHLIVNAVKCII